MACCGETAAVPEAYLEGPAVREARELVAELCRHFYAPGWVTGTGGSITVKVNDPDVPLADRLIVMSPSGVQKERMVAEDMYVFSADGKVLSAPEAKPWPNKPPKCTDCAPLFMKAYQTRGAGAVIHSHGIETCIASMLEPGAKEFRMTHMEMLKAIKGHGYRDELIASYPKATAVLVRNHGIFVWGDSWISTNTQAERLLNIISMRFISHHYGPAFQAESYHYLLDAAIKLYQLGIDWTTPEHGPINRAKRLRRILNTGTSNECHAAEQLKCVVLDIEGTTTPISFVTDVMFPYARDNVRKHLLSTFYSQETKEDIKLLRIQIEDDLRNGTFGAVPVPPDEAGKEEVINSLVSNVESMIKADRKISSLKQLQLSVQGHIWRTGFERKEIQGVVFEDVPEALKSWHSSNIKVYIYSSGSREAQRLMFGNTMYGDLRPFLCGYFDTTIGNKRETRSYFEIAQSLGVDNPSQVLFITDVFQEAIAAKNAGFEVVISTRPGNAPVPEDHGFLTIQSFNEVRGI
ncbi:unnamed protein product [Urochloa decumbens]|uniref:Probable bifunctional methylthioribulose-1-phosphate dehydratase/enolase-phosphatase E1 n=1 Tax=Urochloa decumbens TaxID=240449 RepID=A0ABC9AVD8_9POAL